MAASVLTNSSAMVALQTLRATNKQLATVNSEISTGKKIASAKDGAAVFAISKVMESDVAGFTAIEDSLNLGASTLAVASNAATQVGSLLQEIKGKVVAANEQNVDTQKLQNEIVSLRDQVSGIISAAQFNGLNMVDGSTASVNILSSLDRDAAGAVTTSQISVTSQNLSTAAGAVRGGLTGSLNATTNADDATFQLNAGTASTGTDILVIDQTNLVAGDVFTVSVDSQRISYTVTAADIAATNPEASIATALRAGILSLNVAGLVVDYDSLAPNTIDFGNNGVGSQDRVISANVTSVGSGGLANLATIDVTTAPATALANVETMIQTVVDAQAAFGTAERRVELQSDFMSSLIDSFKAGIGALVDADLEEASARLQAVQVQQQLGIQALSIANQAPHNILALFR